MAEGFVRHLTGDRVDVASAGTEPVPVSAMAVDVMREVGIEIASHVSKPVKPFLGEHFTHVITVCDRASERCPIFPGVVTRLEWNFADPAAVTGSEDGRRRAFREVRDQIGASVEAFLRQGA
jgi:arsenate reductase